MTITSSSYCLTHNRPYDELGCPTFTGAPDARACQPRCEACTGDLVVDDPTSWPYCPKCGWAPDREVVGAVVTTDGTWHLAECLDCPWTSDPYFTTAGAQIEADEHNALEHGR